AESQREGQKHYGRAVVTRASRWPPQRYRVRLIFKLWHHLGGEEFELALGLVPGHEPLIKVPTEPLDVRVLAQVVQLALDIIDRADQLILRLDHTLICRLHPRRLAREPVGFKETEAREILDKPGPLRMRAQGVRLSVGVAHVD